MSPLDRHYHDQLDAQPPVGGDGGDLNGGYSPQPEVQAWHQSGGADDLSRSLLQVQQQEAWLQSQSGSNLLDPGNWQSSAPHGWAAARDDGPSGDASKRLLLVVDTSSAGWQQHLNALGSQPPGADLLFLQPGASGLQQIADALAHSDYNQVHLLAAAPEGGSLQLGSDRIAREALASVLPLGPGQAFELVPSVVEPAPAMAALSGGSPAITTTVLGDAVGLVEFARQSLQEAQGSGRMAEAIAVAFAESNQAAISQTLQALLAGEQQPQIQWARFESSSVRGAFLGENNTILLSETLRSAPEKQLQAVLLEEIGHWLEGSSQVNGVDSAGDEGEIFAAQLFGNLTLEAAQVMGVNDDAARLLINGREQRVELSAINTAPQRLDNGPKALYVIEDAAITPLGLATLAWATGAERDPATDQLRQIADEASQTLTFRITALPAARLGQIGLLNANANNAFVPVTEGAQLSLDQMKVLQFRAAADAYGTGTFTYSVSDGAAAQGGLITTETFTINLLAVNDTPVRTSLTELAPLLIDNTKLKVDPVTNLYKTVSVGLANLLFTAGGGELEQASQQQLLYRISQLPNAALGQVMLVVNNVVTPVVQGQTYSPDQLSNLIFRPARGVETLTAAQRLGELRLEVTDTPLPGGDPARTTVLKVPILIDTNKASGRAGVRIAGLSSDEQAIQAVLALDPTNPDTGLQNPAGGNGTAKGLNTSIYSQLKSDNPLYLAALGGNTVLDGQEVNYVPSAVPFLFDLPKTRLINNQVVDLWAGTWATGGAAPTHTLLYSSTLSGQLRSNDELIYTVVPGSAPAGFTLSSSGAWSFDPLDPAYADLTTEGATKQVTARYQAGTRTGEITIELRRTATTVIAEVVGNVGAMTTSHGDWIASNPEGRDKDRYFKYVSEYVLTSYGARDTGETNGAGEKLFAWGGPINTADGQPLRQLDGTAITTAGYYDFTRRDGLGDGVEFIYETVSEKGKQVDYITGMRFFLRNNVFGDNDPSPGNIRDPGAPVTILRELGVITTLTLTENATQSSSAPPPLATGSVEVETRLRSDGSMPSLVGINTSQYEHAAKVSMLLSAGSAGDSSSGMMAQGTGAGDDDGTSTGSAAGKGAGVGGLDAGANKIAKGRGPGDGGPSSTDGLGKGAGELGLRLDPLPILATAALATPASLLGTLSETNILGANLLDALALGAGLLYLLYGPKAVDQGKRGLRGWLAGVAGGSRRGAAVPGEQRVLSLILTRQENGSLRLVAAQLTAGGVKLLAQQDLASAEAWQEAAAALLAGLQQQGQRYDLLLLDGQLDRALSTTDQSLAALAQQRLPLATAELAAAVAVASPAEFAALQQWLNKPSQALPPDSAVAQALQRRCAVHGQTLPPDQAKMAAMLELSLALTWSQR